MAQAIKSALPSHLKSQLGGKDSDSEFTGRHHGKTRSHMVSSPDFLPQSCPLALVPRPRWLVNKYTGTKNNVLSGTQPPPLIAPRTQEESVLLEPPSVLVTFHVTTAAK
ncbi:hypothetical protein GGR57DRAFT_499719 [Xylariaceae sp. FL1272]|nr:hypothetical protein GGR57DRAFT_499719 [Xylariaceae sp. FL1272]